MFGRGKYRKEVNFDLNIISFIDVMSVLTTFLLMVTVWVHLASVDVTQATGESRISSATPMSLTAELDINKNLILSLRNSNSRQNQFMISGVNNKINFLSFAKSLEKIKSSNPELNTGIIYPASQTKYEELIQLMDEFKIAGIKDIGVSPL